MSDDPQFATASDEDLLGRVASGDAAAFTALFRRRREAVYRFALHMTGVPSAADDVTQEVFLAVMHDARAVRGRRGRRSPPGCAASRETMRAAGSTAIASSCRSSTTRRMARRT